MGAFDLEKTGAVIMPPETKARCISIIVAKLLKNKSTIGRPVRDIM
jgi:hypothetical protein